MVLSLIATCFVYSLSSHGQSLISWSAASFSATFGPTVWPAASVSPTITLSTGFTRGSSIATSGTAANTAYGGSGGWNDNGTDANGFVFVFTPNTGNTVSLSSISAYLRRSGSGPTSCKVQYSVNSGAYVDAGTMTSLAASGGTGNFNTTVLNTFTDLQNIPSGTTVKIRFLPQGSTGGNFYFMNQGVSLEGGLGGTPLPIVLGNVTVANKGAVNSIDWNSLTEAVGDVFEIEHSSNGADFNKIATIKANGTPGHYNYTDEQPYDGINYYRLNLSNNDGTRYYSKIVSATVNTSNVFVVSAFPNPAVNEISVKVKGNIAANAVLSLTDGSGKLIATKKVTAISEEVATFDATQLPAGMYIIRFEDGIHHQSIKIMKNK